MTFFSRGSYWRMVALIDRWSVWMASGNVCMRSVKSTTPKSSAAGHSPCRVLRSPRRCSTIDSTSFSVRVRLMSFEPMRESSPRPAIAWA